jgi:hypothetical protein
MSNTNTGGPAFPQDYEHTKVVAQMFDSGEMNAKELLRVTGKLAGMTLRDYFAAKAMQGLLANPKLHAHILKQGGAFGGWIESSAYGWADAMLKAREA